MSQPHLSSGITWYDVLGAPPGAEARTIKRKYLDKTTLLRSELFSGAPPDVVTAVRRAQDLLDTAWEVLGDPQSRKRYDETVRWLDRQRQRNRPGAVPDVRGLFYDVCLEVAIRHKLHVRTIRLTEHPMAVDGLVVDQDPGPLAKAHRGTTLTVRLWHPPTPSPRTRRTTALTV